MSFYSGLQKTSTRLIAGKGQNVLLRRKEGGAYSPADGKVVGQSEVIVPMMAVVFDIRSSESKIRALGADDVPTDIQYADKKVLIGGSIPLIPEVGDVIEIAGVPHSVMKCTTTAPGGVNLLTSAIVRAGA